MFQIKQAKYELCNENPSRSLLDILPGNIHTIVSRDIFSYIIFTNTTICLINNSDYSLIQIYEGLDEQIISLEYTCSFIFLLCTDNCLYKTNYTNLSYDLILRNISLFSVNTNNKILYLNERGRIFLDKEMIDKFQFDVEYLYLSNKDICVVCKDKIKINDKYFTINNFKFGYKQMVVDSKGIYNLKDKTFTKIKNVENIICHKEIFYLLKENKWYKF